MADKKISELTAATTVNDGDQLPLVQSGSTLSLDASVLRAYVTADSTLVKVDVNQVLSVANSITERGHYSKGAFNGTYTDGIVLDYTTGTGRISVGAADGLSIYNGGVAGTALLNLDSSGNLGLGVVPSAWNSGIKAFDIGSYGTLIYGGSGDVYLGSNWYYNAGFKYKNTNYASYYEQINGAHQWYTAPSGTAGSAISFTQAMTLDASGNLGVGTSSPTSFGSSYNVVTVTGSTAGIFQSKTTGADSRFYATSSDTLFGTWTNTPIRFITNGSETMRLTSAGYLGIGTSSPGAKLDVRSGATTFAVQIESTGTNTYGATTSTSLANATLQLIGGGASGATTGIRLSQGGSFELYCGGVQESGGAAAFVWQGYSGSAYAERMRLDSSGNLGLGVTPSGWTAFTAFQVKSASFVSSGAEAVTSQNAYYNSGWKYYGSTYATQYVQVSGQHQWHVAPSGTAGNAISFTQAMTLDASGNLLVGTTSASAPSGGLVLSPGSQYISHGHVNGTSSGTNYTAYYYNSTLIGGITQNGTTGVLYNITSDQRLKTNVQPAGSAIQSILDFPVDQFDWIADSTHVDFGGVAQKVLPIIPEMVSVPADEEEMMGIDWSKAVPRLIRAYQELHAELQELKATLH